MSDKDLALTATIEHDENGYYITFPEECGFKEGDNVSVDVIDGNIHIKKLNKFSELCKVIPSDYEFYGGDVVRYEHDELLYKDCSSCKHFCNIDDDFGVCVNGNAKRAGLLTFKHQNGFMCCEQ